MPELETETIRSRRGALTNPAVHLDGLPRRSYQQSPLGPDCDGATQAPEAAAPPNPGPYNLNKLWSPQDNYVWILREPSGKVAIVDPSEAAPVAAGLKRLGLAPSYILNTHHHWDHTGGNAGGHGNPHPHRMHRCTNSPPVDPHAKS